MVRKKILNVFIFFIVITLFVLMLPGLTYAEEGDATVTPPEESTVTPPEETTAPDTTVVDDITPPVEEPVVEPEVPVVEVEVNATLEDTTALDTVINAIIDPIITTDKDDYTPGEVVVVRGSGWLAGETVRLTFDEVPYNPPVTYYATADEDGKIYDTQYIIDVRHIGSTITLTATGQTSGLTAQTIFTDTPKIGTATVGAQSPSTVTAGSSATYTITITRAGTSAAFDAALSIITALPTGASASFADNPVHFLASDNVKTTALTISTTGATPAGSTPFTVKAATSATDVATGGETLSVEAAAGDITAPEGFITINSDVTYTNSTSVTLNLSATDDVGITGYRVANGTDASGATPVAVSSSTPFSADISLWDISSSNGTKTVAVQYCDAAGHWSPNYTDSIILDTIPPTVTWVSASPGPNAYGWNNTNVDYTFTINDSLSGPDNVNSDLSPVTISAEGSAVKGSATVYDLAGNSTTSTSPAVKIDKTKPTLSWGSITPTPNAYDWNNTDVTISFTPDDALSGVDFTTPSSSPLSFTSEGKDQTKDVTVTDKAGNSETFTSAKVSIDTTPPTVTWDSASPGPNAYGWNNTNVDYTFTINDSLSGPDNVNSDLSPVTISAEGSAVKGSATVYDLAGNSTTSTSPAVKIDKTPPVVTITLPDTGNGVGKYILNEPVNATWNATDSLSLVDGAIIGTIALDTSTNGSKTVTVPPPTVMDKAGNAAASVNENYSVMYDFSGVLQPINSNGLSIFKLGSTIPVKFQLKDYNGNYILNAVARIFVMKLSNGPIGTEVEAISTSAATTGNLFRLADSQYIFNLATKGLSTGTWQIRIMLDDETSKLVVISLK